MRPASSGRGEGSARHYGYLQSTQSNIATLTITSIAHLLVVSIACFHMCFGSCSLLEHGRRMFYVLLFVSLSILY